MSPDDLIVYSFAALEAWAYEHRYGRAPQETPTEFVRRLGNALPDVGQDAAQMNGFYVAHTYGRRGFTADVNPALHKFWRTLELKRSRVRAEHATKV
jgi:hypothetical protein